jgi:hypothetical protein
MGASRKDTLKRWELFADAYVSSGNGAESAKVAGYKGSKQTLAVAGNRLLKKPEVKKMLAAIRKAVKAKPIPITPAVAQQLAHDEAHQERVVGLEEKRALLWKVANKCSEFHVDEDIQEVEEDDGSTTRIITRTERVFMPETTINAIDKMNQMDGDIKTPGAGSGNSLSIENLLLSIGM